VVKAFGAAFLQFAFALVVTLLVSFVVSMDPGGNSVLFVLVAGAAFGAGITLGGMLAIRLRWLPGQPAYVARIALCLIGVYATLGVFLILASRSPLEHLSLIWFTVWSSLVHAGIMAVQALRDAAEHGHLAGDVPALALVAVVLAVLAPKTIHPMKAAA